MIEISAIAEAVGETFDGEILAEGVEESGELDWSDFMPEEIGEFAWLNDFPEELNIAVTYENSNKLEQLGEYQLYLDKLENLDPDVEQAYQDKIDACKDALDKMNDGEVLSNAQKGNFGEMMMDLEYLKNGMGRVGDLGITELDQSGHNGIDGVYESATPPPRYVIADAKYGSSQLSKETNDGPQMSETWIDKRLDAAVGKDKADEIRLEKLKDPDSVKSELVKISPTGDIQTLQIDEAGNIIKEEV